MATQQMTKQEQLNYLKSNHFAEYSKTYSAKFDRFADDLGMFCYCGKLASSLHLQSCRKFQAKVEAGVLTELHNLIKA